MRQRENQPGRDINQNFQEQTLNGVRYVDYFYYPNRVEPTKLWVRAVVTVESNRLSQDIVDAMMAGARAERLELKHEEAQNRFDVVRRQYLAEEAAGENP
ncbi:MAG TPA: hypothetical protein VN033_12600 [Vulgatibacter sp.]|nr:hypothetical protein [Vulgatibacter sp.]